MDTANLLARWELCDVFPEDAPSIAGALLVDGCEDAELGVIASLSRPTRLDVEELLEPLLRRRGIPRPSRREAIKTVVDGVAQEMVDGGIRPSHGALRIAQLSYEAEEGDDALIDQLLGFHWDCDEGPPAEAEMLDEAKLLLAAGGLVIGTDD